MATRTVHMGKPLIELSEKVGRGGQFSAAVNQTVERYGVVMGLTEIPIFSPIEQKILSAAINNCANIGDKICNLHLDLLKYEIGTTEERQRLSIKIEEMSAAQRMKLIEVKEKVEYNQKQ